jgi:hypothetical protein
METENVTIENDEEMMCCLGCGEPHPSPTGWVDVIDTETMTAQVVCHMSCFDEEDEMILIPSSAVYVDEVIEIPEWAFTKPEPQPVSVDDCAPVVQIRAEWDAVTDVLMYEFNDGDEGVDA